ncbi:uncharacterized protein PAC_17872 [Phialocephala subalpina]|uniref:F-box domain-containing protein n=1 Tax=Phialocephala subalpina TaxID=576137 RepID=A0A1L7XSF4_9HELO|nr:uncharacterized protein PAC_17872 [Phialocephala subalpina]
MSHIAFMDWVDAMKGVTPNLPGCSRLEKLPSEILSQILEHVTTPDTTHKSQYMADRLPGSISNNLLILAFTNFSTVNPNAQTQKTSLFSCLLTSRRVFEVALLLTYRCPKVGNFDKFLDVLSRRSQYQHLVRSLDLSATRPAASLMYLPNCLASTSGLKRLSVPLDAFKPRGTARNIFFGLPQLESIEITDRYRDDRDLILTAGEFEGLSDTTMSSITTLSLTEVLFGDCLIHILPRCPNLRILDLKRCSFDAQDLSALHPDARLTQLILEECQGLNGDEITQFITNHLAVTTTLEVLNLGRLHTGHGPSLQTENVTTILEKVPASLRSLDLGGSRMSVSHIPLLQRLGTQLEELGLGHCLAMEDIEEILLGSQYDLSETAIDTPANKDTPTNPQLATLATAVSATQLQQRIRSLSLKNKATKTLKPTIRHLDLRNSPGIPVDELRLCLLFGAQSLPLHRIELQNCVTRDARELIRVCAAVGWKVEWVGRRIWIERKA